MNPPDPDEFELSIFGPGYGESIVLHLGNGEWGIVDSCVDKATGKNAAIQYLEELQVDPAAAVQFIVATHWHDDHIGGLSQAVEACSTAKLCLPDATGSDEFLVLTQVVDEPSILSNSGVSEMRKVIDVLLERSSAGFGPHFAYAIEGRQVWHRSTGPEATVLALSPSDASVHAARTQIATLLPKRLRPKNAIPALKPNHTAVVLWVSVGDTHVLLGNDLEQTTDSAMGWDGVIQSDARPAERAELVKIAHHGSLNGQSDAVWEELISDSPLGVLAPFDKGRVHLPPPEGIDLLCSRTSQTYSSSGLDAPRKRKRSGALARQVTEATLWIRESERPAGHVCARKKPGDTSWDVSLFGPATAIC